MNPIIDRIHSVDRVSIIVPWSPNIMIRYFIPSPLPSAPAVGSLTTWSEPPGGSRHPTSREP